ncbi:YrhC family protein [Bacillus massilinigeriensis]|uniref:YrhC family protein n=1 Tax=Bacillus mediterraneensis TaxID=1805474 RepID=UPI0008F81267|nr:YrhC family protein [Bacillus mediterraneensis]
MNVKKLYERMVDFRMFGIVLLAVGSFFYFGMIIPDRKSTLELYGNAGVSLGFLLFSILFFSFSKSLRKKLMETDEGQDYLMKK